VRTSSIEFRLPVVDLVFVLGLTVLLVASGLDGEATGRVDTVLTSILVAGYVFAVPGYALVAALFARRDESWRSIRDSGPKGGDRIDGRSRGVLSVALSPIMTALVVLVIDWSPLDLTRSTVLAGLVAFVVGCCVVALARRLSLPPDARYSPAISVPAAPRPNVSAGRTVFVLIAVASVLVAGASLANTAATWESGERFTELYLLTPDGEDASTANEYDPDGRLVVGVRNHEHRPMNYTIVFLAQRVAVEAGASTVQSDRDRSRLRVAELRHGDSSERAVDLDIGTDSPVRLAVLLYRGSPPRTPTVENAYRRTYLWFGVPPGSTNASARHVADPGAVPQFTGSNTLLLPRSRR